MIDFKIKAVLNPKGKRSQEGESIYLCINRKIRHYINLYLEKIPKKAWSGKPLRWVNNHYPYAESHNLVIAREIHHLKEIIQDYYKRNEVLTSEKLKKVYQVKHQGKRIRGVNGTIAPGASDSIVSYINYSLTYGGVSKKASGTKKVYVTLKNLIESYRSHAVMADIDEGLVMGFVKFLRSDATEINSDNTVAKYVDRLKVIYREYCDQYGITFKKRFLMGWMWILLRGLIKLITLMISNMSLWKV
ncbi:MAG: phage integrase SAM-like domain-containing protein [Anditalea sp.]